MFIISAAAYLDNISQLTLFPGCMNKLFRYAWEQRELEDITYRVTRKNEANESDLPLTISAQYGLVDQRTFFNNQVASKDLSGYYLLHKGEFAYNKSTSDSSPWGAVKRLENYDKGCVSTLYICFGLDGTDPDFLVTYYETDRWHKAVQMVAAEGARNHGLLNIAPDDFFETTLMLPSSREEQHTIGTLFSHLDSLITLHQRKSLVLANACITAWEQRKLGDVAEIIGGGTPDTNNPDYWDGNIDWYSPAELGEQIYADASQRRITKLGYENSSAKMLPADKTILFTSRAGIGTTAILRRSACTNQGFQSLVLSDDVNVYFIYSMSSRIKAYAESKASGSTFLEISAKLLGDMDVRLPCRAEQDAIGGYFQQLDNLITLHQRECFRILVNRDPPQNRYSCNKYASQVDDCEAYFNSTRPNRLNKHPIEHRFLHLHELFVLTLMKSDEEVDLFEKASNRFLLSKAWNQNRLSHQISGNKFVHHRAAFCGVDKHRTHYRFTRDVVFPEAVSLFYYRP